MTQPRHQRTIPAKSPCMTCPALRPGFFLPALRLARLVREVLVDAGLGEGWEITGFFGNPVVGLLV